MSGSFTVTLDNGADRQTVLLNHPWQGLLIKPGMWRTLDDFSVVPCAWSWHPNSMTKTTISTITQSF